ncbi:DUF2149 domain-containing protein [Thauera linaloolentis]|uniref:DUF2149 domain-containing protein n=1 Tax=Thauera linaloolentis (strain DSM 12138 / JCM 21573 / CCUG 41526 / CIP 105981 / IAM 15112 / NBRC 102519 / 47Lol) TaxID=1123367 RepID=N6Z4C4_THAL4|nr:DUF2149 domain-containing protein [Thauera linaloolentis]ENO86984.1 hypothetical protein C666_12070 [Thauera linaloolentis 47Lol = DSM 12138]MCM8564444.1 DUF2149 domain-containing protein [Thauera linaloolentis]
MSPRQGAAAATRPPAGKARGAKHARQGGLRLMDDLEADDPILSVVNLIDVFLVIIAALLLAVASNPMNPFVQEDVTVIKNPGQPNMEMIVKKGEVIEHYQASGEIGTGEGSRAGVAYRMKDGSFIYVPESGE